VTEFDYPTLYHDLTVYQQHRLSTSIIHDGVLVGGTFFDIFTKDDTGGFNSQCIIV
jgi:hypothetical protein